MAKIKTECSCGVIHEFDAEMAKKFEGGVPDYIECGECPICSPELLEKPEDHEDEAYREEADIEKLLKDDDIIIIEDLDDIEEEDEDF
jgi:hypothetical protein